MYVYFIEAMCRPAMVKIGISFDVRARLGCLQTAMPFDLKLIGYITHPSEYEARLAERKLHKKLKRRHARGEWFRLSPKTREFILSLVGENVSSMPPPIVQDVPDCYRKSIAQRLEERRAR